MGTVIEPVPVTRFAVNFSPIPRIVPPPFGRFIVGLSRKNPSCAEVVEMPSYRRVLLVPATSSLSFLPGPSICDLF